MTSALVPRLPLDRAQTPADRVVVELLVPRPTRCAPVQHALEEIDDAVALLAQELSARGTTVQVRVTTRTTPSARGAHGAAPSLELRVNGVAIHPIGTQDCTDGGATACGSYEWDGTTYAAPPAELLTAVIHDHLDHLDRDPTVSGPEAPLPPGRTRPHASPHG